MSIETTIEAGSPVQYFRKLKECWQYRGLLWMLTYRDIRVRYAQTILGMGWAIINPILSVALLYIVFTVVAKVDTQNVPSLVYTMAGLVHWNYFSRVVGESGVSIIGAQSLVKKVYFPRLIIPISKAMSSLVDLFITLLILAGLLIFYKIPLQWSILEWIPLLGLTMLAGLSVGIWISALTIRFRDFTHIVPLLLRIGMFLSPIAYGLVLVPEDLQTYFMLNPLTGIIEAGRSCLFGLEWEPLSLWISVIIILSLTFSGLWYFIRMDQYIADIL